jgi:hypothetical protein
MLIHAAPRHQLNALSPLQQFSPLTAASTSPSAPSSGGGRLGVNIAAAQSGPATFGASSVPHSAGGGISTAGMSHALYSSSVGTGESHSRNPSGDSAAAAGSREGRRSRASSVTSKLSRRDSLIARGEGGAGLLGSSVGSDVGGGLSLSGLPSPSRYLGARDGADDRSPYTPTVGSQGGLISKLILVKAPHKGKGEEEEDK